LLRPDFVSNKPVNRADRPDKKIGKDDKEIFPVKAGPFSFPRKYINSGDQGGQQENNQKNIDTDLFPVQKSWDEHQQIKIEKKYPTYIKYQKPGSEHGLKIHLLLVGFPVK
jgi:hypothetical protein